MRIAAIGDVHGCISELKKLVSALTAFQLDEIWVVGDLVDRGPDSGAVVEFCRLSGIRAIMGNHESSLLDYRKRPRPSPDRERSHDSIRSSLDWDYLESLPDLHVVEALNTVLVHGGLWPHLPLHKQPPAVKHAQMINPYKPGDTDWWGESTEPELYAAGYRRWTEVYDGPETAVYGHSVYKRPAFIGNTIGIDTGCVYGGSLTAIVLPERKVISIPAAREYYKNRFPTS